MKHRVFISYASENSFFACVVCDALEDKGIRCWIAPRDVGPEDFADEIESAIRNSKAVVVILSRHANNSKHVKREIHLASNSGIQITPFRIDDVTPSKALAYYIGNIQWVDATSETLDSSINKLISIVAAVTRFKLGPDRHELRSTEYMNEIVSRLKKQEYAISRRVQYNDHEFQIVAWMDKFSGSLTFGLSTDCFWIFSNRRVIRYGEFVSYSESCAEYAQYHRKKKLLRPMQAYCIPVVITSHIDSSTALSVENMQPLAWPALIKAGFIGGVLGLPTIYDLNTGRLLYSRRTPYIKASVWVMLRRLVSETLTVKRENSIR